MPDEQYDVAVNIEANDQASGALGGIAGQADEVGQSMKQAGTSMMTSGAMMAAGLAPAAKEAAEAEATLADVKIQSGATAEEMQAVREASFAKEMEDLGKSGAEAAASYKRLAAEGYEVAQMRQMMIPMMEASVALGTEESQTTKLMIKLMEQYNLKASEQSKIADVLAGALANTSFQGRELAGAMSYAGTAAGAAGMSMEETVAVLDPIAKKSRSAATAGRYFRQMIQKTKVPTKRFTDELKKTSVSAGDLQAALSDPVRFTRLLGQAQREGASLTAMYRARAGQAAQALIGEGAAIEKTQKALEKQGFAHDMASAKMDTAMGKWEQLRAQYSNLAYTVGKSLLPVLESLSPIIEDIAGMVEYVMSTGIGKWLVRVAGYAAAGKLAFGGLAYGFGSLVQVGGKLVGGLQLVAGWLGGGRGLVGTAKAAIGSLRGLNTASSTLTTTLAGGAGLAAALTGVVIGVAQLRKMSRDAERNIKDLNKRIGITNEAAKESGKQGEKAAEGAASQAEAISDLSDKMQTLKKRRAKIRGALDVSRVFGIPTAQYYQMGGAKGVKAYKRRYKTLGQQYERLAGMRERVQAGEMQPGLAKKAAGRSLAAEEAEKANKNLASASNEASDELAGRSLTTASAQASKQLGILGTAANRAAGQLRNVFTGGGAPAAAPAQPGGRQQTVRHEVRVRGDGAAGDSGLLKQLVQSMMQDPEMRKRMEKMMGQVLRTGYTSRQPA